MFETYLSDVECYIELEKNLNTFFRKSLADAKIDRSGMTYPFYVTRYSNGQPFLDGNHIFSVKDQLSGRSLRVILDEDTNELTSFQDKEGGTELVIVANIGSLAAVKQKITEWIKTI